MSSIWSKILTAINEKNFIFQAKGVTIDDEVKNLDSLITYLQLIRSKWDEILYKCKTVATALGDISSAFPSTRIRKNKRFPDDENQEDDPDEETTFKNKTFFVIIDSIIAGISERFDAMKN